VTPGQLEEDWRRHVRTRYGWLLVVTRSAVSWTLLGLLLLLARRLRRTRDRRRMARLRATEPADDVPWWAEEPGADPSEPPRG